MGIRVCPTAAIVRKGFEKHAYWSMAETYQVTGLAVSTLYKHAKDKRFTIIKTPSPYKCHAKSVREYYQREKANGIKGSVDLFTYLEK